MKLPITSKDNTRRMAAWTIVILFTLAVLAAYAFLWVSAAEVALDITIAIAFGLLLGALAWAFAELDR
jgi:uncharacterized membrane protein (DUF485 family)